jgi:hypothetical protein
MKHLRNAETHRPRQENAKLRDRVFQCHVTLNGEKLKVYHKALSLQFRQYFLNARLSVTTVHSHFKAKYPGTKVKYNFYTKLFRENFNLRFVGPRVGSSITCKVMKNKIKNNTQILQQKRPA